ncbi:hypothetical protein LP421_01380 (plasmid) [Rhizobium sp. RCAM05350]|nr:hypothetical protein LP421_01380 [Rhizobium sp. RCAM05350]
MKLNHRCAAAAFTFILGTALLSVISMLVTRNLEARKTGCRLAQAALKGLHSQRARRKCLEPRADCGTKTFQINHLEPLQRSANGFLIGMP